MIYTVRDSNGNAICSIENTNTVKSEVSFESINNELEDINDYSNKLNKSIEAFVFVSDAKAMESFGYRATEGFGEKIKNAGKAMWENIKKFFNMILDYLKKFGRWIAGIFKKDKNDKTSPKTTDKVKNDYKDEKINNYVHDPDVIKRAEDIENEVPIDIVEVDKSVNKTLESEYVDKIESKANDLNKLINNKKESKPLSEEKVREVISKDISNMSYSKKTDETNNYIKEMERIINKLESIKLEFDDETRQDVNNSKIKLINKYISILKNEINRLTTNQKYVIKTKELNSQIENDLKTDFESAIKWLNANHIDFDSARFEPNRIMKILEACKNNSSINNKLKYIYDTMLKYSSKSYKRNISNIIPADMPFNAFIVKSFGSNSVLIHTLREQTKRAIVNDNIDILIPGFLHRVNRSIYNYIEVWNEIDESYLNEKRTFEIIDFDGSNKNFDSLRERVSIRNHKTGGPIKNTILVGFEDLKDNKIYQSIVIVDELSEYDKENFKFWKIAGEKYMD